MNLLSTHNLISGSMLLLRTLLAVACLLTWASAQSTTDLPVESLDASYLSSLRAEFGKFTKIHQCARVWRAVDERLRREMKLEDRTYPKDNEALMDLVDLNSLQRIGTMLRARSGNNQLAEFMDECANMIGKYRRFSQAGNNQEKLISERRGTEQASAATGELNENLQDKLARMQTEKVARDAEYKRQMADLDAKIEKVSPNLSPDQMQLKILSERVARLKRELADKDERLSKTTLELLERTRQRDNLQLELEARDKKLADLNSDLVSRDAQISVLKIELSAKLNVSNEQESTIKNLKDLVETLQLRSPDKENEMINSANAKNNDEELERRLDHRDSEIEKLKSDQAEQEQQFKSVLSTKVEQISNLSYDLTVATSQITNYRNSLHQCADALTETRAELMDLDEKQRQCESENRQLNAVLQSKKEIIERLRQPQQQYVNYVVG